MKRIFSVRFQSAIRPALFAVGLAAALVLSLGSAARADKVSDARDQFESAVKMRTMLEGYLEKDRSLDDYQQTIAAYYKVYLISPQAEEVTPSFIAQAELYQEMGRLYDPRYFQSAIGAYNFLLKQYPGSRYCSEALLATGKIERDDLNQPDVAEASFKELIRRFPRSEQASEARDAAGEIAGERAKNIDVESDVKGEAIQPRAAAGGRTPSVTAIRSWNAEDSTRIVVTLDDTIAYNAAHIPSPDRIYFDLYKAQLSGKLAEKSLQMDNGLLKSVRLAQNKPDVVRLVLDVSGAKNYSSFLLSNPYRLVIDVRSQAATTVNAALGSTLPVNAVGKMIAANSNDPSSAQPSEVVSSTAGANAILPAQPSARAAANPIFVQPSAAKSALALDPVPEPKPTRDGDRSLTRVLGLKISRIVIDPGHGGFDTGTIGPHGLREKDLCLDVALRLGRLIQQKLPGAQVIYTRHDDTFIPLEQRTAIANQAKADLFISIHANSSPNPATRGVETYYLNFDTSPESMEVASRENARSDESMHDLQGLIQKIARNDKIEESKELAGDIQDSLSQRLQYISQSEKNRGVKKAPFVVLIGAEMPSVLTEISFVSNPSDEHLLRNTSQRQRIADGLYRGIATYLGSLNSLSNNKQKLVSDNHVGSEAITPVADPK
ncbi:MAG: N-acetylmuramoyl-L-alanine amidase [Candidatus Acidiferrales bacterium]